MKLEIPEGANIQIIIGRAPHLALTDQRADALVRMRGRGIIGGTLKFAGIFVLVFGAFWVGEQRVQTASADTGFAAPLPVNQAFPTQAPGPGQAVAQTPATGAGQVPPGFQAQLKQPPSIQPPPGQNDGSGSANGNPFGLQPN
jgi:hypothetical protein